MNLKGKMTDKEYDRMRKMEVKEDVFKPYFGEKEINIFPPSHYGEYLLENEGTNFSISSSA